VAGLVGKELDGVTRPVANRLPGFALPGCSRSRFATGRANVRAPGVLTLSERKRAGGM
jgi:hypothetical protein